VEVGRRRGSQKRCTGDDGTALVEMAFMIAPLCLLLFGIIVYGYMMSFRQNMTQAAAEGARAGAVAPVGSAKSSAEAAAEKAVSSFGQHCGSGGMTCTGTVLSCATTNNPNAQCIQMTITYDEHNHPILPDIPLVTSALPDTFTSVSTVQINT
jgi:Flp pilus assembly protein TadG